MKKTIAALLACLLLLSMLPAALAETALDGKTDRSIAIQKADLNTAEDGVSPTTGRTLADVPHDDDAVGLAVNGNYMPMVVQIDNDGAGIGSNLPWGLLNADIIYEMPLYRTGETRLTAVFSDVLPTFVGPVRSARIGAVWLAKEWFGGFVCVGRQESEKANADKEMKEQGFLRYVNRFDGTDNKPWTKYFTKRAKTVSPHQMSANLAGLYSLIPGDHHPYNHTMLFTDEPLTGGDSGAVVAVDKQGTQYSSTMVYMPEEKVYYRYLGALNANLSADGLTLHVDRDSETPIAYNNVIVQFTDVTFPEKVVPIVNMVGSGNADFFMNGQHVAGCWERENMESRTVFYGPDGQEMKLQRGKTLIVIVDRNEKVLYQ